MGEGKKGEAFAAPLKIYTTGAGRTLIRETQKRSKAIFSPGGEDKR